MKRHVCPRCQAVVGSHRAYESHQAHAHHYYRPHPCLASCSGLKYKTGPRPAVEV